MPESTLLQHEVFEKDGKWFRRTTVSDKANYRVHKDGSMRHAVAQFKGGKKDRKRFKRACLAAVDAPLPLNHVELQGDVKLQKEPTLDFVYDVSQGKWVTTPYYACSLLDLQQQFGIYLRAARSNEIPKHTA